MKGGIYQQMLHKKARNQKSLAVLLDPDYFTEAAELDRYCKMLAKYPPDLLLFGGSLVNSTDAASLVRQLKRELRQPVVLFPGDHTHIVEEADGILLLSLISGRNPEYLIGQHVLAAHQLKASGLEILPTGYMLVDCGSQTTAHYVSQTLPLPGHKPRIAAATALAGEQLGLKLMYLDGGSGSKFTVDPEMVRQTVGVLEVPLIAGGGIRTCSDARCLWQAGADVLVVGTAIEHNTGILPEMLQLRDQLNKGS